ncbi:uncharacterized protein BDZ99DRAFT_547275 [Mytilinidion resinicola]|uniref:Uncharacterized protein n=1 Tax=Mytilinidion resinicola TaxID=574789 RepID=A0A6A6Y3C8_9PEZI|nr:uncharacterized protein BDZ99DRAFT_547275 [Mytilinidion resinicola]KAF2803336.1 hypothetical protein BDZ99DRAFT_547275 [Mytilinidion resinicola]
MSRKTFGDLVTLSDYPSDPIGYYQAMAKDLRAITRSPSVRPAFAKIVTSLVYTVHCSHLCDGPAGRCLHQRAPLHDWIVGSAKKIRDRFPATRKATLALACRYRDLWSGGQCFMGRESDEETYSRIERVGKVNESAKVAAKKNVAKFWSHNLGLYMEIFQNGWTLSFTHDTSRPIRSPLALWLIWMRSGILSRRNEAP